MNNIGIIGKGFVGTAVAAGFSPHTGYDAKVRIYDVDPAKSTHSLHETVNESEVIFVSVPTPASKDGAIDLSIIHAVLKDISSVIERDDNIILIRSTIVPGTSLKLQKLYPKLNIVFNPEFLTELNSYEDFLNQKRIILGGENTALAENLYAQSFKDTEILILSYEEAEMVKYFANTFLATKVAFANEMFTLCKKMNINYNTVVSAVVKDERIGRSHFSVPGPDGKYGFGGSCFPKDLSALIFYFNINNIESIILNSVWERNVNIDRQEKDWNQLKGRAVE